MADHKYLDMPYLEDDDTEPEVQDLGHIVEDREDRRGNLLGGGWERLEDFDSDEALEENEDQPIPLRPGDGEPSAESFATLYNLDHVEGQEQEDDFVRSSMPPLDPDAIDEGVG